MPRPRTCSVGVDLDPLACYYGIHGLGACPPDLADVVFRRSVPRYLEIFARHKVRATFFIVGSVLAGKSGAAARALVREMAAAGHELASHSHTHPYDLARLPRDRLSAELRRADGEIAAASGTAVVGFRAPGYDVSADVFDELAAMSYTYDSSIFPAPGYYAAKALVLLGMRLTGRTSAAVMTDPRTLTAPALPYRPDPRAPWRRGQGPLVELPVAVTPWLRIPAIGTSLLLSPTGLRARWLDAMRQRWFFNLELHGIDLLDAERDGIPAALVARQPDLRAPLVAKQRAFEATLDRLALDYRFETLREVATRVQREG